MKELLASYIAFETTLDDGLLHSHFKMYSMVISLDTGVAGSH